MPPDPRGKGADGRGPRNDDTCHGHPRPPGTVLTDPPADGRAFVAERDRASLAFAAPSSAPQKPPRDMAVRRRTLCKSRPRCCADRPKPVAPARQGHARTAVPASPGCAPMVSGRKGPVGHCPHGPQAVAVPGLSLQRPPCGWDHQRRTGRKARCFRFTDLTQPDAAARQTRPRRGSALTGLQVDGLRGRKRPVGGCPQGAASFPGCRRRSIYRS